MYYNMFLLKIVLFSLQTNFTATCKIFKSKNIYIRNVLKNLLNSGLTFITSYRDLLFLNNRYEANIHWLFNFWILMKVFFFDKNPFRV